MTLDFSGEVEVSGLDQFLIKPLQSEKGRDKKISRQVGTNFSALSLHCLIDVFGG